MEIRFGMQQADHRSKPISSQKMINCYLEATPPGSKSPAAVIPSYGITELNDITDLKGGAFINGVLYVVGDAGFYSIDSTGTETLLSSFTPSGDALILGDAGGNRVIVSGNKGYNWNGSTLTEITDSDLPTISWMGQVNGFYIAAAKDTGQLYGSTNSNDPTAWDALDTENAKGSPDDIIWGLIDKKEVVLFGRDSTEFWYYSGGTALPFAPVANGMVEIGIMSEYAAGKIANGVFFMGNDGIVYMFNGYSPQRISTHAIEQKIEGYTKSCRCYTWHESGHAMVGFKFAQGTIVYDLTTQLWHTRRTYNKNTWDVHFVVNAYNYYVCGGPTLGKLVPDVFTEYGDTLRAQCTSAAVYDRNNLVMHDRLELVFENGVGDAQVMLKFSDDGGRTWSNEKWAGLGAVGKYAHRVIFNRLGSARDRVYEYAISDPYRRNLINANLNEWG